MRRIFVYAFACACLLVACGPSGPKNTPVPAPTAPSTPPAPAPSPEPPEGVSQCPGESPGEGYACMQACGPPVVRDGDPPPPFRWMSPEQQASREKFGCPKCLPPSARIDTPRGRVPVAGLVVGDTVWTLDGGGERVERALLAVSATPVGPDHHVTRITLADGRLVTASPGHPVASGQLVGELVVGARLDGSTVQRVETIDYAESHTYDILPAGPTGSYWAEGVLLDSTLRPLER